ncbi:PAS-domain containing protein [Azospirillum picis]|uniref:histidine kinase n=1 Tax=Azospirillum picis TaxID=488438 RepID=A0ABU0MJG6_9PROT|nr:PAS-domain containing protein [Azospirillum picis]MBP2299811.1 PAS domain S-box-containing protein [Azospirillum picis]MDQ0533607.1 PAS domain S-box-containing protein [Azospirillum picis]
MLPPVSVRGRLLAAFGTMVVLTAAVGGVGWIGLGETERSLLSLQRDGLGNIALAMRMAELSTGLAARAPFIAAIEATPGLDEERSQLELKLADLTGLVNRLPGLERVSLHVPSDAPSLVRLAGRLDGTLRNLMDVTGEAIAVRAEAATIRLGLERQRILGETLAAAAARTFEHPGFEVVGTPPLPFSVLRLADRTRDTVSAALSTNNPADLARWRTGFEADRQSLRAIDTATAGLALLAPSLDQLLGVLDTQAPVFDIRGRQLGIEQRSRFLVAAANTLSVQLNREVESVTTAMQSAARSRSDATFSALSSGKAGILALGVLCALAAVAAAVYVMRDVAGNLRAVTRAMSALAGGDRLVSVPATGRPDEIGDLARAFSVFKENVAERDALARKLGENSRMLKAVFDNMNDGLSVFDENGRLVTWNPRFLDLNGFTPAEVAGRELAELQRSLSRRGVGIHMLDGSSVDLEELTRLRTRQAVRCEHHFPDGRVVELHSSPMPSGGFITTYSDLTERKDIEKQLRHAQKMEAVGQLTGGIAHDFNNLLAAIIGNLQMIHDETVEQEQVRGKALRALDAAERGATTIQRLLAFSRQQALQPQAIDLNELVEGMLDLLAYGLGGGIVLKTELAPGLPPALVDPGQLENALLNLVVNARDALADGGTIVIATEADGRDAGGAAAGGGGDAIVLSVRDNGSGMPPAVLSRVFEPFFTTKRFGRGSGLGLSMVYGFVRQSGGKVDIHSEVGAGTRVAMSFPCARLQPEAPSQPRDPGLVEGGRERVLVVEDDATLRMTTVDMLTALGYRAVPAASAEEALVLLERTAFDLLFTDVILTGGMNGPALVAVAKVRQPSLQVLFCSGYARDFLVESASLPLDIHFIQKPYQKPLLAAQVRNVLGNGAQPAAQSGPVRSLADQTATPERG